MDEVRKDQRARENADEQGSRSRATSRQRIQRAQSEARRFENPGDDVLVIGQDGILLHQSRSFEDIFDAPTSSLLGRPVRDALSSPRLLDADPDAIAAALCGEAAATQQDPVCIRYLHEDGTVRILEGRVYRAMRDPDLSLAIFCDATERWQSLEAVCVSEERFRRIAEASRDMVTESDSQGVFAYVSSACLEVLGYRPDELVGTRAVALHHEDDLPGFLEELREARKSPDSFSTSPHRLRHKDGHWIWAEATGLFFNGPHGGRRTLGVARDITAQIEAEEARHELEEGVMRTQKLESLGILAGGVAHDFNNLLTPIVGNAAIVHADLPPDSPLRKRVEMIRMAANRATELTGQMLAYAGEGATRVVPVNVSQSVREMTLLLESTATRAAELHFDLANQLPLIEVDPAHVGQVVMNLVANASDSLPMSGGNIHVRTGVIDADDDYLAACTIGKDCAPGRYVFLEVSDDGLGIEPVNRARIFDPFFTTRFTGRGLGLAAVHGIVSSYGGALDLESAPCEGTRFRVLLPAVDPSALARPRDDRSAAAAPIRAATQAGRGVVLVVDDDEGSCDLVESVLTRSGFQTLHAEDGPGALEVFRQRAAEIAGVVLDCTMPGMSGPEVFEQIRQIRSETPVILISGHARERAVQVPLTQGLAGFVQKPFEIEDLMVEVDRLFDPPTA